MNPARNDPAHNETVAKSRRIRYILRSEAFANNLVKTTSREIAIKRNVFRSTTVCLASQTHQVFQAGLENRIPVIKPITARTVAETVAISIHGKRVVAFRIKQISASKNPVKYKAYEIQ